MNYIKQINAFYKLLPNNPITPNAQCLYLYLLNKNNELGWIKEFTVANMIVCGFTSLNKGQMERARNCLVQKGYIKYIKGKNQNQAGTYEIIGLCNIYNTTDDVANDTADDVATERQMIQQPNCNRATTDIATEPLNKHKLKHKQNKKEVKEKEEKRVRIKNIYNSICTKLPQIQKITEKREKAIDKFIKEFTEEQFEQICNIANSTDFLIGKNDRKWKADFDFLMRVDKATSVLEGKYSSNIVNNAEEEFLNG